MISLSSLIPQYDLFLLDLWGVVHDGSALYDGVLETLRELKRQNKTVIFISNAPRRAEKAAKVLDALGITRDLYQGIVTSGEVGYRHLQNNNTPHPNPERSLTSSPQGGRELGRHYFFIGPSRDADVLDGLEYVRVDDIKAANFLLNVGFGSEEQTSDDFAMLLRGARALGLPMICLNPDLEVVKITGERFPCAGVLGKLYEQLGGEVIWFGKPYGAIYDACLALYNSTPLLTSPPQGGRNILAVGDSLETDIPGGQHYGIDTLLITGGILKNKTLPQIQEECLQLGLRPTYVAAGL